MSSILFQDETIFYSSAASTFSHLQTPIWTFHDDTQFFVQKNPVVLNAQIDPTPVPNSPEMEDQEFCPICPESFTGSNDLLVHIRNHLQSIRER